MIRSGVPSSILLAGSALGLVFVALAVGSCDGAGGAAGGPPGAPPAGERAAPAVPIAVESARTGSIASYYVGTATLEAEKETRIVARVSGIVSDLGAEEGDDVTSDQVLVRIANEEYRYRHEQARSARENLASQLARLEKMSSELVSLDEFESVSNQLARAVADEGLAQLQVEYGEVKAPFAGRVVERLVDVGHHVEPGTPLFAIADLDPLLARVHVPSKEFRRIETGQPVSLVLDSTASSSVLDDGAPEAPPLTGTIRLIAPTIDSATGTIKVTVEIPTYPPDTRPGDFAEVRIVTERREGSTLVPKLALVSDKGDQVVYVAAADRVERRSVTVGFADDESIEILGGVRPGEQVVVKGQRSLEDGAAVRVVEDISAAPREERTAAGSGG